MLLARRRGHGCSAAALLIWATVLVLEVACQQKNDHYKILGVKKDSKDREIKKAYHKLALKHHPDKSNDCKKSQESPQCKRANRVFMKISLAYETLSNPEKKRYYDQTGFDDPSHAQQHSNQQRRGGGGGGNQGGGGGGPQGQRPQAKGLLDPVNLASMKGWLQDAVNQKKPVLLLFAPAGHSLIEQLGKIKKNDDVKMAKFGHVTTTDANHPLMKKYKIKNLPAVLIGSKGDPAALHKFEGKMDADAIERALSIAVRNKLTKEAKQKNEQPLGRDLVTNVAGMAALHQCFSHHGICMLFFFTRAGRPGQQPQGVKYLEKLTEQSHKHKQINKKLKVIYMWLDVQQFPQVALQLGSAVRDREGSCSTPPSTDPNDPKAYQDPVCRRPPKVPTIAAILGKKSKFVAYFNAFDKSPESTKGVLDFLSRVSMGDETMHKVPASIELITPPAA